MHVYKFNLIQTILFHLKEVFFQLKRYTKYDIAKESNQIQHNSNGEFKKPYHYDNVGSEQAQK